MERERALLHVSVASFYQTTPEPRSGGSSRGSRRGLLTKSTPTGKGGCQGEHGHPWKGGPPPPGSGEDSQLREWGLGCQIQPAAGRSWLPISSALGPRPLQAQGRRGLWGTRAPAPSRQPGKYGPVLSGPHSPTVQGEDRAGASEPCMIHTPHPRSATLPLVFS